MLIMSSENAGVDHLVVDACGFINNTQLQSLGKHLYTVPEVINELRDKAVRERLRNLPYEVMLKEPSSEALKIVTEASKKSGDYIALSATDLKVLALTYQLHLINKKSKRCPNHLWIPQESVAENKEEGHDTDASDDQDWVGEQNFAEAVAAGDLADDGQEVDAVDSKEIKVACLTTDFSIQNLLLHMKMKICSADGLVIKRLNSYILRCRSCYSTTAIMTKEFCPKCGHKTLHRVAVSVDESGTQHLHIDFEKLRVTEE
uniref:RNA-binding protein NOB1 n=1 Tax=Ditylenchus dipsaci TaxID=166011 RepID=A0A915DM88_9BILA